MNKNRFKFPFAIHFSILLTATGISLGGCNFASIQARNSPVPQKKTVGWVENTRLLGTNSEIEAKLDTGAKTTSINAEILDLPEDTSEAGGMVRFRFIDGDDPKTVYERPILEWVRIKDGEGGFFRRPVIKMQVCIGNQWVEEEVNLADRSQFNYSVLIGRNMLKKTNVVVDSSQTKTTTPKCSESGGESR
ncbi:MAG: hypothetical protein GVY17_00675 [Cyanobacteria bacterium]|jgi:hypothetical protein|nr:hypothetical protein [Cyanobacteria bacterium GSL.Bin21]